MIIISLIYLFHQGISSLSNARDSMSASIVSTAWPAPLKPVLSTNTPACFTLTTYVSTTPAPTSGRVTSSNHFNTSSLEVLTDLYYTDPPKQMYFWLCTYIWTQKSPKFSVNVWLNDNDRTWNDVASYMFHAVLAVWNSPYKLITTTEVTRNILII